MLNGGPISWKSRRQDSVALSTSEAEYMAASLCGQEVVYIRAILRDFGVQQNQPTLVYEDNLACIAMSVNPVRRKHSRHIDIRRHYIRELCLGRLLPYDSTLLESQDVLQIESLFPIRTYRKYGLGDHKNCGACTLTREEF